MPHLVADSYDDILDVAPANSSRLPFPPLTKSHILNCSIHAWYQQYKRLIPKTRLVPLSAAFLSYLRADGILLPPEQHSSSQPLKAQDEDEEEEQDPSQSWPEVHSSIQATIQELGGKVYPKLNWSAPKDATWIGMTNSMECSSPNDIYLLLKSSDFVTHDLEQAFVDCTDANAPQSDTEIPYTLALRKAIPAMINSMEFRCFVRRRQLIAVCQRDLNYYDFMESLLPVLEDLICDFFEDKLRDTFPEDNFVFDVYIPSPVEGARIWLIDINPWAQRTDSLLFSWRELLTMADPLDEGAGLVGGIIRMSLIDGSVEVVHETETADDVEEIPASRFSSPEIRLIKKGDPETYTINTPLYGAHKLPKDVVDAGMSGAGGMREFLDRWNRRQADPEYDSDGG